MGCHIHGAMRGVKLLLVLFSLSHASSVLIYAARTSQYSLFLAISARHEAHQLCKSCRFMKSLAHINHYAASCPNLPRRTKT